MNDNAEKLIKREAQRIRKLDNVLLDEPLKPLPVKTGTVRVLLRYAGKGEPILQGDTE